MSSAWAEVETLMRELGGVWSAAAATPPSDEAQQIAIKRAIGDATEALFETAEDPQDADRIGHAREAIETARDLVKGLAAEVQRSRRAIARAAELGVPPRSRRGRGSA
jgi:hypothetical protein